MGSSAAMERSTKPEPATAIIRMFSSGWGEDKDAVERRKRRRELLRKGVRPTLLDSSLVKNHYDELQYLLKTYVHKWEREGQLR